MRPSGPPILTRHAPVPIEVPLFSDLRRHKMGEGLKERDGFRQATDG